VDWSLGSRPVPPDAAVPAVTAGIRLDDAIRGYLAEQGSKRLAKQDLWRLVMGSLRVRLTAYSLASLHLPGDPERNGGARPGACPGAARARAALRRQAAELAGFYQRIAALVGPPGRQAAEPPAPPALDGSALADGDGHPDLLWVREHLSHLAAHAQALTGPASLMAGKRRRPWWR
jgi:hypothetical protein